MDEQIATAIEADHVNSRKVPILQSVKGCGPVTVNTFMAELSKLLDSSIGRKLRSSLELLPSTMIPDFRPGNERPLEVVRQCVAGSTWRRPTDRTLPCHSAVPGRESSTTQRRCCQCASRRTTHHACRRFARSSRRAGWIQMAVQAEAGVHRRSSETRHSGTPLGSETDWRMKNPPWHLWAQVCQRGLAFHTGRRNFSIKTSLRSREVPVFTRAMADRITCCQVS